MREPVETGSESIPQNPAHPTRPSDRPSTEKHGATRPTRTSRPRRGNGGIVHASSLVFVLLASIAGVAIVAKRLELPYPIAFVIGGCALAFVPNLPPLELDPDLVFLIFLPPLLYAGGWSTDWKSFKENLRPIGLLAIGLVIFTTGIVAIVFHAIRPELGWAPAFVLGAVISPPDAVAAGSVFERFSIPRRILAILDGEGLVNDATALVIYRFAVAAVVTGAFSFASASLAFVGVAVGGVLVGIVSAIAQIALAKLLRRFELGDTLVENTLQLVAPYTIYTLGESLHVSGVLATVAAGIFVSRRSSEIYNAESRLIASAVWEMLIFILNGSVFLLIGLELRPIVHDRGFAVSELWIGLAISVLVIAVRVAWVFPASYLPRLMFPKIAEREGPYRPRYIFVVGWSGMRGIVSLASALAIPLRLDDGHDFPGRAQIVFVTFCVIFVTLVFQGLSLIPLLKWMKIEDDDAFEAREIEVRVLALRAGIARLRELETKFDTTDQWEVESRILGEYEYRIGHLSGHLDGSISEDDIAHDHELQQEALDAERREIARLREIGEIPDEIYRKVQYDLDLADERLH